MKLFDNTLNNLDIRGNLKDPSKKLHPDFKKAERWTNPKTTKSKSTKVIPGPADYELTIQWKGKSKEKEKDNKK